MRDANRLCRSTKLRPPDGGSVNGTLLDSTPNFQSQFSAAEEHRAVA